VTRPVVAIIGAGIAGASAAWELSLDHEVVLIEQEQHAGVHATGRSAAILSETSGSRAVCALARASRPFLESPPDDFVEHRLTSERGLLWVARHEDAKLLQPIHDVARSGVAPTARRLAAHEAKAIHPALRDEAVAGGALFEPDARSVDVAALLQG
jgi:D-arginine dehydrogenase